MDAFVANAANAFYDPNLMTPREFSQELKTHGFTVDAENKSGLCVCRMASHNTSQRVSSRGGMAALYGCRTESKTLADGRTSRVEICGMARC